MIELSLLGPHVLRGSDGREITSLPAQPKRFALLAYLALGSGGYRRRDTLAAMFWPDLDQFAARRALRNTLYHLREALGDDVIITRGDDAVSINGATAHQRRHPARRGHRRRALRGCGRRIPGRIIGWHPFRERRRNVRGMALSRATAGQRPGDARGRGAGQRDEQAGNFAARRIGRSGRAAYAW